MSGAAHLTAAGADGFDLEATRPGAVIVRQHASPYWTVVAGDGCVSADRTSGWTLVDVGRAGMIRVRARFSAAGALRRKPDCAEVGPTQGDPLPASAVSPPVTGR